MREDNDVPVYDRLLRRIVTLELPPGQLCNERTLMAELACTRTELTQALNRLVELDLVNIVPRRGIAIAPVDLLDTAQLYEARLILETGSARLAAQRRNKGSIEKLSAHLRGVEQKKSQRTEQGFIEADIQFHLSITALSGNSFIYRALERLLPLHARIWYRVFGEHHENDNHLFLQHSDLFDAIDEGDADLAEEQVRKHISQGRDALMQVLWPGANPAEAK